MAQPQITKTKWTPQQGGLTSDIDPKDLSGGNLLVNGVNTGGMNVRNVGKGQNVMMDYEPIYGNEYVYTPDTVVVQNKKWRIYADVTDVPPLTGNELIVNGDFTTNLDDWDVDPAGSWIWAAGTAQSVPTPVTGGQLQQTIVAPYGNYTLTFDVSGYTAGTLAITTYNASVSPSISVVATGISANGSYSFTFDSLAADSFDLRFFANSLFDGAIDNVSLVLNNQLYGFDYTLSSSTGSSLLSGTGTFDLTDSINNTLVSIENFITTDFTAYNPSATSVITGSYTGYVEFELTTAPYFDYDLQFNDTYSSNGSISLIIVQEAIDTGCLGEWNLIGSDDKPSDSFQFWTTRMDLPVDLDIFNITLVGGLVRVTTVYPHGLVNDEAVRISNVISLPEVNGIWTITYVNDTEFYLNNCVWVGPSYTYGGVVTKNICGVGEIGVAVKDDQGVITYTRLLRSKEFNFSTLKQIDCRAKRKQDIQKFAVYYTDNYNVPRVFYYKGAYQTDGALNYISSDNIYDYGNISSESRWLINNEDFYIEVVRQDQIGGALKSGNWRYSARLITSDFSSTQWSQLTEGIPVFKSLTTDVTMIGSNPDVVTSKINVLKLTNNMQGIFSYVEIAAVNYFNNLSPQGFIIGRYELLDSSEQFISHTGNENNQLDLDIGSLNNFSTSFIKSQNVELLDNRAILSNLTPAQTIDFSEWVKTFKYSLNRKELSSCGNWANNSNLQVGEYQDPMNVYSYKSHMMLETYRYGFMFKLRNGSLTQVFYPGYDIKIDLPASGLPINRLPGTFTTFDLTDSTGLIVYSIYISWENINLSFLIDGVPAYDLISEIIPCRADVIPEVLFHGNIVLGVNGRFELDGSGALFLSGGNSGLDTIPYPFIAGSSWLGVASPSGPYPSTNSIGASTFIARRNSFYMHAPDNYFNINGLTYLPSDELYVFGNSDLINTVTYPVTSGKESYYGEFTGYTNQTSNPTPYLIDESLETEYPFADNSFATYNVNGILHNTAVLYVDVFSFAYIFENEKSILGRTSLPIVNVGPGTDRGFYRAIYFRGLNDKYGNPSSTRYSESLFPYRVEDKRGYINSGEFNTYGDCFTQKSYLKLRYPGAWDNITPGAWDGWGMGVGHYTQNRNNIQLRCNIDEEFNTRFSVPTQGSGTWVKLGHALPGTLGYNNEAQWQYVLPSGLGRDSQLFYNLGYTPSNNIVTNSSFNPSFEYQTDWGNAIAWSNLESEGSNTDNLRNFPPLNLKFLDYTQGPITDARAINGELYTIQPREVQRQYFDTTAVLTTQNGGEAYLGTGAVLSRRGNTMNKFGSRHKWSIIMGLSDKGGDVVYGIDDINNTVWRLGYDGTNSLDEIQGMKSFFANNLSWIRGKYTPANDEGIRGVANQRYREVIWTLRGRKQYPEWNIDGNTCQLFSFQSTYGNELVFNGNILASGNLTGWDSYDVVFPYAPTTGWGTIFVGSISGYVARKGIAAAAYLAQANPLPLVVGSTYLVQINCPVNTDPMTVSFQLGGPAAYTISGQGTHIFNYTAQPGDDNICILGSLGDITSLSYVSVRESLQSLNAWSGGPDWVLSNNEACTIGSTVTPLIQLTPNYTIPNTLYILTLSIEGYVSGDLSYNIGTATSSPIGIVGDGVYVIPISASTTSGFITFIPDPILGFEGCIKGNIKLCTTAVYNYYNTGDIVQTSGYGGIMATWSQTPDLWICLKDDVLSNPYYPPDPDDPDWQLIPHTNPDYYTEYTIVYNELKNKFQTFMTILPKIYAHFQNGYLVPKPISDTGRMYVSDTGIPTTWFETNTGDAYLDAVINSPAGRKRYLAARVESDVAPTSMTVTSSSGFSTTNAGEFEQREGQEFDGYVKDTSTESIIMGDFGIFRFTFAAGTYNKLNSFIASVRERARKWFR